MGKGSRNRQVRVTEDGATAKTEVKLSKKQLAKKEERRAKAKKYIAVVACLVIIVAIIAAVAIGAYNKANILNGVVVGTSEKYEVDGGMVAYYMNGYMRTMQNYYYSSYGQQIDISGDDYKEDCRSYAVSLLNNYVALASEAQSKGYKLDKTDYKGIDDEIDTIKEEAKTNNYSLSAFLAQYYCEGVNESTVRRCMELEVLARKYYKDMTGKYKVTDEDINKYFEENPGDFRKVDYISYSFEGSADADATDEEKKNILADNKAKAEELLSKITDEQSFRDAINELERQAAKDAKGAEITDDDVKKIDETDYSAKHEAVGYAYRDDNDFAKWAFNGERKVGDTYTQDGKLGCTVYYLLKTDYYDNYRTRNIRYILIGKDGKDEKEGTAKATAEKVLKEYESGKKTEDAFAELAKKYSKDTSTASDGGLYENLDKGTTVAEFDSWVYDASRKAGDCEVVESEEYGYFLIYYISESDTEKWHDTAKDTILTDMSDADVEKLTKKYTIKWDEKKLAEVPYNA